MLDLASASAESPQCLGALHRLMQCSAHAKKEKINSEETYYLSPAETSLAQRCICAKKSMQEKRVCQVYHCFSS